MLWINGFDGWDRKEVEPRLDDVNACSIQPFDIHTSVFLGLQNRVSADKPLDPVFADRLARASCLKDAVGEDLDLLVFDRKTEGLLDKNPIGQVFLLVGAELLHDLGFVLAFWLRVVDDTVPKSRKRDSPGLTGLTYGLATVDGLDGELDDIFGGHFEERSATVRNIVSGLESGLFW